jgi:hypothetical protein
MEIINENVILHDGKEYHAVEGIGCEQCDLSKEPFEFCEHVHCLKSERADGKDVILRLEKIIEPPELTSELVKTLIKKIKEEVQKKINEIIDDLFIKNEKGERVKPIKEKIEQFNDEAINWGSLHCFKVEETTDGMYYAHIDEASPDSYKFADYIQTEMKKLGYNVYVITEW